MTATAEGEPVDRAEDRAERWRAVIRPFLQEIWPLDAQLRDQGTSRSLIMMALSAGDAFPEAVDVIADFIVPYQFYLVAHQLCLQPEHNALVERYPRAFLRLASAIVDPACYPVPSDLAELLRRAVHADPDCQNEPSYVRLSALSRHGGA